MSAFAQGPLVERLQQESSSPPCCIRISLDKRSVTALSAVENEVSPLWRRMFADVLDLLQTKDGSSSQVYQKVKAASEEVLIEKEIWSKRKS